MAEEPKKDKYKYYAGGAEITADEHSEIYEGKKDKLIRCPDNQPGICLGWLSDHVKTKNKKLDATDPYLKEILNVVGLHLNKTYIVHTFMRSSNPRDAAIKGAVYGYW